MAFGRVVLLGDAVALGDQITSAGLDLGVRLYNAQRVDIGRRISLMRPTSAPTYGRNSAPSATWLHATAPRRGDDRDCRGTRHQLAKIALGSWKSGCWRKTSLIQAMKARTLGADDLPRG